MKITGYHYRSGAARLDGMVRENVIAQLANLRTHPSAALALTQHRLTLHGWVYDIATGRFVSLAEHPGVSACWRAPDDRPAIARCG